MRKEKWLPVIGYEERYFVINLGRVKNGYPDMTAYGFIWEYERL